MRLYALPEQPESSDAVLEDLREGKISNLETFKLRLLMSLQGDPTEGVEAGRAYDLLTRAEPDLEKLASRLGWPAERVLLMNDYKGMKFRFYWLTVRQTVDLFCENSGGFRLHCTETPSYELGQRCPVLALRRHSNGNGNE